MPKMPRYAIFVLLLQLNVALSQVQFVEFFPQANCAGEGTTNYTGAGGNVPIGTPFVSFRAFGLWKVQSCPPNESNCAIVVPPTHGPDPVCVDREFTEGSARLVRFGNPNQDEVLLRIFSDPNLLGTSDEIRGNSPNVGKNASSYYFVGDTSWQVYEEPNYQGMSSCLVPETYIEDRGYGINYFGNNNKTFGSVCIGCGCTGESTTLPPVTTTTIVTSTNPPATSTNPPATNTNPPTSTSPPATSTNPPASSSNPPVTTTNSPVVTSPNPPATSSNPPMTTNVTTNATTPETTTRQTSPIITTPRPNSTTNAPATSTEEEPASTGKPSNAEALKQTFVGILLTFLVSLHF